MNRLALFLSYPICKWRPPLKPPSLACRLMRLGNLDVDLDSGVPISRTSWRNRDGYCCLSLHLERPQKRGKPAFDKSRNRTRYRERQTACVHRIAMMKFLAIREAVLAGACGSDWRLWVVDIPKSLHVDHLNFDPSDNRICNLRLLPADENLRRRFSFSKEEEAF